MEAENTSQVLMGDDMPHKEFMEDNGLVPTDFSDSLREKLSLFDIEFSRVLNDGIVTEENTPHCIHFRRNLKS